MAEEVAKNKVVLIGDHKVGKTSLFMRFKMSEFQTVTKQTRQEAEYPKTWKHEGQELCITLYDTAGMERFEATVPPTYFRHAKAVILVYALDNDESVDSLTHWADSMSPQRLGSTSRTMFRALVGNKSDLDGDRVSKRRAMNIAETCDIDKELIFEVSAKTGEGVEDMFNAIAIKVKEAGSEPKRTGLPPTHVQEKKSPCCNS